MQDGKELKGTTLLEVYHLFVYVCRCKVHHTDGTKMYGGVTDNKVSHTQWKLIISKSIKMYQVTKCVDGRQFIQLFMDELFCSQLQWCRIKILSYNRTRLKYTISCKGLLNEAIKKQIFSISNLRIIITLAFWG